MGNLLRREWKGSSSKEERVSKNERAFFEDGGSSSKIEGIFFEDGKDLFRRWREVFFEDGGSLLQDKKRSSSKIRGNVFFEDGGVFFEDRGFSSFKMGYFSSKVGEVLLRRLGGRVFFEDGWGSSIFRLRRSKNPPIFDLRLRR